MVLGTVGGFWSIIKIVEPAPLGRPVVRTRRTVKRGRRIGQDRSDAPVPDRALVRARLARSRADRSPSPIQRAVDGADVRRALAVHARRHEARAGSRPLAGRGRGLHRLHHHRWSTPTSGPKGRKYVPWVFSLFMFILFANLLGMMPFALVGRSSVHRDQPVHRHRRAGASSASRSCWSSASGSTACTSSRCSCRTASRASWPLLIFPIELISFLVRPFSLGCDCSSR